MRELEPYDAPPSDARSTRGERSTRPSGWQLQYDRFFLETLFGKEAERPRITLSSPQLKYRGYLVVCIRNIVSKLNLGSCVLHSAIRILDIFMDSHDITLDRLRPVAFSCLFIAAKFELEGRRLPQFSQICKIGKIEAIPKTMHLEIEFAILHHLKWDMCMPNVATFLSFFSKYAISPDDCKIWQSRFVYPYNTFEYLQKSMNSKINDYLSTTLLDVDLSRYSPSAIATSCLMASRQSLGFKYWPKYLEDLTKYSFVQIQSTTARLTKMLEITISRTPDSKRRRISNASDDEDQGYCTAASSPDGGAKKARRVD